VFDLDRVSIRVHVLQENLGEDRWQELKLKYKQR